MQLTLVSSEHGLRDFDVVGLPRVHRACVPNTIKKGGTFNVYCDQGVKLGAVWKGALEASLARFATEHPGYQVLLAGDYDRKDGGADGDA